MHGAPEQPETRDSYRLDQVERKTEENSREITGLKEREQGREVRVEVATAAMNRNAGAIFALAVCLLGAVVAFILTGSHG